MHLQHMFYLYSTDSSSSEKNRKKENYIFESKSDRGGGEHPAPEAGKCVPWRLIAEDQINPHGTTEPLVEGSR